MAKLKVNFGHPKVLLVVRHTQRAYSACGATIFVHPVNEVLGTVYYRMFVFVNNVINASQYYLRLQGDILYVKSMMSTAKGGVKNRYLKCE
jgi:hypothetical protein